MSTVNLTLNEYFEMCKRHDWYYKMSDDHEWYLIGRQKEKELIQYAESNKRFDEIYKSWKKFAYSGDGFGVSGMKKPSMEDFNE